MADSSQLLIVTLGLIPTEARIVAVGQREGQTMARIQVHKLIDFLPAWASVL